ncbi:MAG: inorganic phosphate transporter family protein [Bacteroidales bacterium]|nr:inorganic phosphate transporter family protein [Bacteroidales bacterium]
MYIDPIYSQLILPLIISLFLAINMGASGTAPSFSAAFGANLIPKNLIPGLFGIMVFAGAVIAGKNVAITLGTGFLPQENMTILLTSIILLSVALSLLMANLLGIPQSTSQSTVFALSGASVYFGHFESNKLFIEIIPTWLILPFVAFGLAYIAGKYIYSPHRKTKYFEFETLKRHSGLQAMVIISSLYVAFSIGANNVANASGPVASMVINELELGDNEQNFALIMMLSILIIAPAFGIGSSLMGTKVMHRTGKEIVELGPVSATLISFITASLLLSVSLIRGIPASLVQLNTGAILAIGCAKHGCKEIFSKSSVRKFWIIWIIAPLFAFLLSITMIWVADKMGVLAFTA